MKKNILKEIKGAILLKKEESKTIVGGYLGIPINTCGLPICVSKFYVVGNCNHLKIYKGTAVGSTGNVYCVFN